MFGVTNLLTGCIFDFHILLVDQQKLAIYIAPGDQIRLERNDIEVGVNKIIG